MGPDKDLESPSSTRLEALGTNISVSEISPGLPDLEVEREARGKITKKAFKRNTMKRANPENCV